MSTVDQVKSMLVEGELKFKAAALAAVHEGEALGLRLKGLYESAYGVVALDIHDWLHIGQGVKNAPPATPADDSPTTPVPILHQEADPEAPAHDEPKGK